MAVKDCTIKAYARHLRPLSREGTLSCRTRVEFLRSNPKDHPKLVACEKEWVLRTFSNREPPGRSKAGVTKNLHIKIKTL